MRSYVEDEIAIFLYFPKIKKLNLYVLYADDSLLYHMRW